MEHLPIFINLKQKPALVVGGGDIALRKINLLIKAQAKVNCLSLLFCEEIKNLSMDGTLNLIEKSFNEEDIKDYSIFRAMADSEALRLKYSNNDIYNKYKPGGEISQKLYKIAEKIRYEKIGCEVFTGIKKNLFFIKTVY